MIGYTQVGNGEEKVLMVHGWKTDHTCFDGMASSLNKSAYTYIQVDQRGYGKSMDMDGPYNVEQVAEDMAAFNRQPPYRLVVRKRYCHVF